MKKYYKFDVDYELEVEAHSNGDIGFSLEKSLYTKYRKKVVNNLAIDKENIKYTDILKTGELSLNGLVISNKLFDILNKFPGHKIQYTDIINEGIENYKFMFFNGDLTEKIDYQRSEFELKKYDLLEQKLIKIDYYLKPNRKSIIRKDRELIDEAEILTKIIPKNGYVFKKRANIFQYDILRIGYFDENFYVSELVKSEIEKNGITGYLFGSEPIELSD